MTPKWFGLGADRTVKYDKGRASALNGTIDLAPVQIKILLIEARLQCRLVLVVITFDQFVVGKKSPVHDQNLHQNIDARAWRQNEVGDTMKQTSKWML
jgi:hypothetical protein